MRAYLWTLLVLLVLEVFGRALWIAHDEYLPFVEQAGVVCVLHASQSAFFACC